MSASSLEKKIPTPQTITKVLIADDDAPTRTLLRVAISQWGYEITEAEDGMAAWQILQNPDSPQLAIFDWLMPGLDGVELCKKIKNELNRDFYIILLTQQTGAMSVSQAFEAGANEFLSKPFNMAELRCRLTAGADILKIKQDMEERIQLIQKYDKKFSELETLLQTITKLLSELPSNQNVDYINTLTNIKNNIEKILDPTH